MAFSKLPGRFDGTGKPGQGPSMRPYDFSNIDLNFSSIKQAIHQTDTREKSFDNHRLKSQNKIFSIVYRTKLRDAGVGQDAKPKVF